MVYCHPIANCFHQDLAEESDSSWREQEMDDDLTAQLQLQRSVKVGRAPLQSVAVSNGKTVAPAATATVGGSLSLQHPNASKVGFSSAAYVSSFIIGLSYQRGQKYVDVGPAIQVR